MGERIPPESPDGEPDVPPPPLDYVRPTTNTADRRRFPVAAGMGVGLCVFLATAAMWWPIGRLSVEAFALGLAGVPLIALLAAGVLQARLGWRGVVAGVLMGVGLAILIPAFTLLVICGGMRL